MEVSGQLLALAVLPPRKQSPGTHCIGGWMGPRTDLAAVGKSLAPAQNQTLIPIQLTAHFYTY
jgi:hypothetical protein